MGSSLFDQFRNAAARTRKSSPGSIRPFGESRVRKIRLFRLGLTLKKEPRMTRPTRLKFAEAMPALPPEPVVKEIICFPHKEVRSLFPRDRKRPACVSLKGENIRNRSGGGRTTPRKPRRRKRDARDPRRLSS